MESVGGDGGWVEQLYTVLRVVQMKRAGFFFATMLFFCNARARNRWYGFSNRCCVARRGDLFWRIFFEYLL